MRGAQPRLLGGGRRDVAAATGSNKARAIYDREHQHCLEYFLQKRSNMNKQRRRAIREDCNRLALVEGLWLPHVDPSVARVAAQIHLGGRERSI